MSVRLGIGSLVFIAVKSSCLLYFLVVSIVVLSILSCVQLSVSGGLNMGDLEVSRVLM